jgi:hypothetical protein
MQNDWNEGEPLEWRKRSLRSRLRRWHFVVPSILFVLLLLSAVGYRHWRLSRVPDIGDRFPVSEIFKPLPDEENAFLLFAEAHTLLKEVAEADSEQYLDEELDGWDSTATLLNKYLELNRPALEKWREATEKENHQIVPIADVSVESLLHKAQANRELVRWCQMEIERLTQTGKPADAIPWFRASFRCGGLVSRNAPFLNRIVGMSYFATSASSAHKWAQHPEVTRDDLLDLLAVVQAAAGLMEKPSTTIKMDYLTSRQYFAEWSYDDMKRQHPNATNVPQLRSKLETWLLAEPEYSRRVNAHVTANHLAFIDDPRRKRPPLLDGRVFDEPAVGVTPTGRLPADKLIEVLKDSKLIEWKTGAFLASFLDSMDRQRARWYGCLQVALAGQAYFRDRGEFPKRLADLQPDYLSSLPDDPYSPQPTPVIYRRTDDGAVVYSRFDNEIDDGGTIVTFDEARGADLLDFGFRLRPPQEPPVVAPVP